MSEKLRLYMQERRTLVERHLGTLLRAGDGVPASLVEAMRYSVLSPGKRLRPILVFMSAEACGASAEQALAAASAVECVHVYSLIHDDLPAMDDDDLRRGQPTCHKKFGEAMAILAGDALLTMAFQIVAEGYPAATGAAACRELSLGAGAGGMVGGQVEDLAFEMKGGTLPDLESIHVRKTGALFRTCLRLGVLVAQGERPGGVDRNIWDGLDAYGRAFGLVFQITDDLLDSEGTAAKAGKRVGKDAARGKLTYPSFLGAEESRRRAQSLCAAAKEALRPLGDAGNRLSSLLPFILERDR